MDAAEQTATGNGRLSFARRRTAVSSKLVCKSLFNLRCRLRSIKYDVVQSYDFGYKWRSEFCRLATAVFMNNYRPTPCLEKSATILFTSNFAKCMLTDFQNYFTDRLSSKF